MVTCRSCGKNIANREDVNVLALLGVKPVTFCNNCYASKERRSLVRHALYFPQYPLNGRIFAITLAVITIIMIIVALLIITTDTAKMMVGGAAAPASLELRLIFASIIIIILLWFWSLWIRARNIMNQASSRRQ